MKKVITIGLVAALGLLLTGVVYAWQSGHGMGYGMGYGTTTNVETMKKFHKETFGLRDEIMTKQLELQGEYSKPTPDTNRIAAIQKEIIDLRARIHEIATKHGISMPMGQGMRNHGMMGRGMMGGMGAYNCPMY